MTTELNGTGPNGTPIRAWTSGDQLVAVNEGGVSPDTMARLTGGIPRTMLAGGIDNFTATSAPTATNDSAGGYAVGSRWLWAARGLEWVCVDATAGAAVWRLSTSVYPPALVAPRQQSFYMDGFTNIAPGNGSGPWGGRWYFNSTTGWSRSLITGGNGKVALRRSTSATQFGSIVGQSGNNSGANVDAGATLFWKSRVLLRPGTQAAPTAAEDYRYTGGFSNDLSIFTPANNATFVYYQTGGTVAFEARTRRASGTVQVTALTPPNADQWLTLEMRLTGSNVVFWVDGTLVATHTTVPTGGMFDGDDWRGIAGTSARAMDLDFLAMAVDWGL